MQSKTRTRGGNVRFQWLLFKSRHSRMRSSTHMQEFWLWNYLQSAEIYLPFGIMLWDGRNETITASIFSFSEINTLIIRQFSNSSGQRTVWTKYASCLYNDMVYLHTHNHVIYRNQWFLWAKKIDAKKSSSRNTVELSILCKNRFLLYNLDFLFCCSANCRIFGTRFIHMAGDLSSLSYKITSNSHWIYQADKRKLSSDEPCVKTSDSLCGKTSRTNWSDSD